MAAGATPSYTGMLQKAAAFVGAGVVAAGLGYAFLLYTRKSRGGRDDAVDDSPDMQDQEQFPEKRVLVLGLDNGGKSSLLQVIASHDSSNIPEPTEGFNVMCLQGQDTTLNVWEVGGKQSVRSYWDNFVSNTDVLVFVVDSADVGRFPEAKEELHKLLRDERLKNVPLILVANKQDLPASRRDSDVSQALDLGSLSQEREIHVVEAQTISDPPNDSVKKVKSLMDQLSKKD